MSIVHNVDIDTDGFVNISADVSVHVDVCVDVTADVDADVYVYVYVDANVYVQVDVDALEWESANFNPIRRGKYTLLTVWYKLWHYQVVQFECRLMQTVLKLYIW